MQNVPKLKKHLIYFFSVGWGRRLKLKNVFFLHLTSDDEEDETESFTADPDQPDVTGTVNGSQVHLVPPLLQGWLRRSHWCTSTNTHTQYIAVHSTHIQYVLLYYHLFRRSHWCASTDTQYTALHSITQHYTVQYTVYAYNISYCTTTCLSDLTGVPVQIHTHSTQNIVHTYNIFYCTTTCLGDPTGVPVQIHSTQYTHKISSIV